MSRSDLLVGFCGLVTPALIALDRERWYGQLLVVDVVAKLVLLPTMSTAGYAIAAMPPSVVAIGNRP